MSKSRYNSFNDGGARTKLVPFIEIPKKSSDYYISYEINKTRLDKVSYDFYGDANYGWLILQANPEYDGLEFNIPNKSILRIPFPLSQAIKEYEANINIYNELYT